MDGTFRHNGGRDTWILEELSTDVANVVSLWSHRTLFFLFVEAYYPCTFTTVRMSVNANRKRRKTKEKGFSLQ